MAITNGFLSRFFRKTRTQTNSQITSSNKGRKVLTTYTPNPPRYMFRFKGGRTQRDTSPTVVSGYTQSLQRRLGGISSSNRSLFSSGINNMANYFSSSRFFSWA